VPLPFTRRSAGNKSRGESFSGQRGTPSALKVAASFLQLGKFRSSSGEAVTTYWIGLFRSRLSSGTQATHENCGKRRLLFAHITIVSSPSISRFSTMPTKSARSGIQRRPCHPFQSTDALHDFDHILEALGFGSFGPNVVSAYQMSDCFPFLASPTGSSCWPRNSRRLSMLSWVARRDDACNMRAPSSDRFA
jgi:hypothetical protein